MAEQRKPENQVFRSQVDAMKSMSTAAGIDFSQFLPVIIGLFRDNPQLLATLLPFILQLFQKAKPNDTTIAPKPELPPTQPVNPPNPVPAPVPNPDLKNPVRLELKIKGVKRKGKHIPNNEVEKVRNQSDPVNTEGDVVNLDLTPFDRDGDEMGPNTAELNALLVDPKFGTHLDTTDNTYTFDDAGNQIPAIPWPAGYDNHRIHHIVSGPADQGGEYRNFGCGVNVNPTNDGTITVYAECLRADGTVVKSNSVTFRAKYWQS